MDNLEMQKAINEIKAQINKTKNNIKICQMFPCWESRIPAHQDEIKFLRRLLRLMHPHAEAQL